MVHHHSQPGLDGPVLPGRLGFRRQAANLQQLPHSAGPPAGTPGRGLRGPGEMAADPEAESGFRSRIATRRRHWRRLPFSRRGDPGGHRWGGRPESGKKNCRLERDVPALPRRGGVDGTPDRMPPRGTWRKSRRCRKAPARQRYRDWLRSCHMPLTQRPLVAARRAACACTCGEVGTTPGGQEGLNVTFEETLRLPREARSCMTITNVGAAHFPTGRLTGTRRSPFACSTEGRVAARDRTRPEPGDHVAPVHRRSLG